MTFFIYIDELVEIFLKLSMKTVQVHFIIWTTLVYDSGATSLPLTDRENFRKSKLIHFEWNDKDVKHS